MTGNYGEEHRRNVYERRCPEGSLGTLPESLAKSEASQAQGEAYEVCQRDAAAALGSERKWWRSNGTGRC